MATMDVRGQVDLSGHGIDATGDVIWNASTPVLYEHAIARREAGSPRAARWSSTPARTRAARRNDKFIVREPASEARIWWDGNRELPEELFDPLREKVTDFLAKQPTLYVVDAFAGADPAHRIAVRVDHDAPVSRALREDDVHRPDARRGGELPAAGARPACSGARGEARGRRHAHRTPSSCCIRRAPKC